jgi:hypothetical protein
MEYTSQDIADFFGTYQKHITHTIVAHTNKHTIGLSDRAIDRASNDARKDLRYALNCFNKLLYPKHTNLPTRKPLLFKPLCFVTIEGARQTSDAAQTIHFNISFGNLPKSMSTTQIEICFRNAWHVKAGQSNDIFCEATNDYPSNSRRWFGYILKEAQQDTRKAWTTNGTWDVENCWIPHTALTED